MARFLTKSRFKLGTECPTKLYYSGKSQFPETKSKNEFLRGLARGGYQVGEYAKLHFPGGVEITTRDKQEALAQTRELMARTNVIIYEAAVSVGNTYALVDILVKVGDKVRLIEVKSKSWEPDEQFMQSKKPTYIDGGWRPYFLDVAFQTWVARQEYPSFEIIPQLMVLDKSKHATVDGINQHFPIRDIENDRFVVEVDPNLSMAALGESVMAIINAEEQVQIILNRTDHDPLKRHPEEPQSFEDWVLWMANAYTNDVAIPAQLASICKKCEFRLPDTMLGPGMESGFERCWMNVEERPLHLDIWNYRQSDKHIKNDVYSMTDESIVDELPNVDAVLNNGGSPWEAKERQALQVYCVKHDITDDIVNPGLFAEMETCQYPIKFIDFEAGTMALPFHKGRRPYESVAFQFSIHTLYEDGRLEHTHEWLSADPGVDPNTNFVRAFKAALEPLSGTHVSYSHFENTKLKQLRTQLDDHPDLQQFLDELIVDKDRGHTGAYPFVDMWVLLKKYYYHPGTNGSNSIKYVLPAILGYDPYASLDPVPAMVLTDYDFDDDDEDAETINDGGKAMMAWAELQYMHVPDDRRAAVKEALLRYCELDTKAMADVWLRWLELRGGYGR